MNWVYFGQFQFISHKLKITLYITWLNYEYFVQIDIEQSTQILQFQMNVWKKTEKNSIQPI